MYSRKFKSAWLFLITLLICLLQVMPAAAATTSKSKVNSVTIHVKSMVEAGDFFADSRVVNDDAPEDGEIGVWVDSSQYEVSSTKLLNGAFRELPMGEVLKIRVVLEITDPDNYNFKSEFLASNVKVSGEGKCTDVTRSNTKLTVTLELPAIKGQYTAPDEVWWSETGSDPGLIKWDASSTGSGYYDVQLRRSGSIVKEVESLNATNYNFYPYMTVAGRYTVKVRAVPHSSKDKGYAKASGWVTSESLTLSSDEVSDGTGAEWDNILSLNQDGSLAEIEGATAGQAGWIENNGYWYYKYPNGTFRSNGWELINGSWYLFDEMGRMRTGRYKGDNGTYYLDTTSGAMVTGWLFDDTNWYYLDADSSSPNYGKMLTDAMILWNGNTYYVGTDGRMAYGWTEINGQWYYFAQDTGAMAKNTWVDTFYVDENGVWRQ